MKRSRFTHQWVTNLLVGIEGSLNPETTERLLEACGRACARGGAVVEAADCAGDVDGFVLKLRGWIGEHNVSVDGATVHLVYERCYCTSDPELPRQAGGTFCSCSRGWIKEMFETVVGRPVEVDIVSTIAGGAEACRFNVRL